MGKCDVCQKEKETRVAASSVGAMSFSYCEDCLQAGLEPYSALVAYCAGGASSYEGLSLMYRQLVDRCLEHEGLSIATFNHDVAADIKEYNDWLNTQDYQLERTQDQRTGEVIAQVAFLL